MSKERILVTKMFSLFAFCLVSCGSTESSSSSNSENPTDNFPSTSENTSESSSSEENSSNDKVIDNSLFINPRRHDRPMVMIHGIANSLIDDVYDRGYGGIVTNVAWGNDYLQSARAYTKLRAQLNHAINNKGMYVWLYDEYGYPSGAAYGQTLKGNPEYEALGLVTQAAVVADNKTVTINLLYGHKAIVAAYVFDGTDTSNMDLTSGKSLSSSINSSNTSITYKNRTGSSQVLVAYMSKQWYEGTHSMENWYAQQRYINMLEPGATNKFIEIVYDKYYEYLSSEFGKGIKAFFTDEPAHQGNYFTISDRNRVVIDVPDLNIELFPSLNYSESLFDVFVQTYNYRLEPYLGYLYYDDNSSVAKQVRMDFYELTSELFRSNYLGQIADWTSAHGVKSSGHLLLEETLYQNPWFAGNMIQLLGTMGIPGTDLLFSQPVRAMKDSCVVSKMASSAADFLQKEDTFAEISGAFDGTVGDIYEQINTVGVQVAMGINNFASYYYQGNDHTFDEDVLFSTALGRMRYMVTGSTHQANVALYYPYEGVSAETLPSTNMYNATHTAKEIDKEFRDIAYTLVQKQIDYDLVDHLNLSQMNIENGALVSPNGERFTTIIIPYTTALYSSTVLKLNEAVNAGVKVIIQDIDEVVVEHGKNGIASIFKTISQNATNLRTSVAIANYIRDQKLNSFFVDDKYAVNVYMSKRANENYDLYTVVNAYKSNKELNFTFTGSGTSVKYYNTLTGAITSINASYNNSEINFKFTLPSNSTGFFVVEK